MGGPWEKYQKQNQPSAQQGPWTRYARPQIDPQTGERIQIDPATGERVTSSMPTKDFLDGATPVQRDFLDGAQAINPTVSVPEAQPTPPQPGFLKSLLSSFGLNTDAAQSQVQAFKQHPVREIAKTAVQPLLGPLPILRNLWDMGKQSGGELMNAAHDARQGNWAGVGSHAISAIPLIGPALDTMNDAAPPTHPGESWWDQEKGVLSSPGAWGTGLGTAAQIAPMALGLTDLVAPQRPLVGEIPTRAKAGKLFDVAMSKAEHEPVQLTNATDPMERAQQLSARGHGTVSAVDNLFKRINTVNPLDYREARDWGSSLSNLTGNDEMGVTRSLKSQVKQLSRAFNQDVGDAAERAGVGDQYQRAMRMYAQAARNREFAGKALKYALPTAAGGYFFGRPIVGALRDLVAGN
jgi:hypothetical protein